MMRNNNYIARIAAWIILSMSLSSCLFENDMSYPVIEADILSFEVEGQKSVVINAEERTVSLVLGERADISHLKLVEMTFTEEAELVDSLPEYLDLSDTLKILLRTYEDYEWSVSAVQPIVRYVSVDNQVGETEFDVDARTAVVYVSENQELSSIRFVDVKLEPEGSVVKTSTGFGPDGSSETVECRFPMVLDCVHRRIFTVEDGDELYEWSVKVLKKRISQQVTNVESWCYHAKVYGLFTGNSTPYIEYRKASDEEWIVAENANVAGVGITADITGLEPGTEYVVRVEEDGAYSAERTFTTDMPVQIANMNFDQWYLDGKIWYPYAQGSTERAWDSANPGAATFIGSSTTPEESFVIGGKAARLESKYAVIAFAAGNIYTGAFGKIAGVGAELDWGVPFDGRPSALKGYYSYSPKPIDKAKAPHEDKIGRLDKCQILVLLTDWTEPFRINTTKGIFVDQANDPSIIAFGKIESDEDTGGEYREFVLPLEYRDKTRRPTYAVIACCASYLGDYFTGGVGSLMYVDEFEFIYE